MKFTAAACLITGMQYTQALDACECITDGFGQRRVILVFWPTLASSCHQISIGVPTGSVAWTSAIASGKLF